MPVLSLISHGKEQQILVHAQTSIQYNILLMIMITIMVMVTVMITIF